MIKKYISLFCFMLLLFPSVVWAGFFSRNPVNRALDDYESDRNTARQKITVKTEQVKEKSKAQPAQVVEKVGGAAQERKTFETEFGYETYAYKYQETVGGERFMRLKGVFYGIYLRETFRPNQLNPFYSDLMDFFRLEARLAWARLDYNGGISGYINGNPVSLPLDTYKNPDVVLETRLLLGKDLFWKGYTFTPYSGLGFRFLKDDESDVKGTVVYNGDTYETEGGYVRKSYYYYLPVGLDVRKPLTASWQIGWNAEFDYLLQGFQKSYTKEQDNEVTTNKQPSGWGARTSVRLEWDRPSWGLSIEPFYRFWNIEVSEFEQTGPCIVGVGCPGAVEPSNITKEAGVKMGLRF